MPLELGTKALSDLVLLDSCELVGTNQWVIGAEGTVSAHTGEQRLSTQASSVRFVNATSGTQFPNKARSGSGTATPQNGLGTFAPGSYAGWVVGIWQNRDFDNRSGSPKYQEARLDWQDSAGSTANVGFSSYLQNGPQFTLTNRAPSTGSSANHNINTATTRVRVRAVGSAADSTDAKLLGIWGMPQRSLAERQIYIILDLDDPFRTGYAYLDAKIDALDLRQDPRDPNSPKWKITLNCAKSLQAQGHIMQVSELQAAKAKGHEIDNHSTSHLNTGDAGGRTMNKSGPDILTDYNECATWIQENNLNTVLVDNYGNVYDSAMTAICPFGGTHQEQITYLRNAGYWEVRAAGTTQANIIEESYWMNPYAVLPSTFTDVGRTFATIEDELKRLCMSHGVGSVLWHGVEDSAASPNCPVEQANKVIALLMHLQREYGAIVGITRTQLRVELNNKYGTPPKWW